MNSRKDFYRDTDQLSKHQRRKIWSAVESQMTEYSISSKFRFDWKNYTLGLATCILLIFSGIGVRSLVFTNQLNNQSELSMMNSAYSNTIIQLEKIASNKIQTNRIQNLDELLQAKGEQLNSVSSAIFEISNSKELKDFESIKEKRLRQLYLAKLQILDEIIAMEGGIK